MNKLVPILSITAAILAGASLSASAATPDTTLLFNAKTGNQQGLATDGHYTWLTQDAGSGNTRILTYTWDGTYIGTSALLPLGHGAEVDYRVANDRLYVANGGLESESTGADAKVYEVSLTTGHIASAITKTYDFSWLGRNALVAIDNSADKIVAMGGPDAGPWTIVTQAFVKGTPVITSAATASTIGTVNDPGVLLQGLGVKAGQILLYVSQDGVNRIDTLAFDGTIVSSRILDFTGEAEGLAVNPITGSIYLGAHSVNRVMRLNAPVATAVKRK